MEWLQNFYSYIINHPLLFIYFNNHDSSAILESRRSSTQFSFTRYHNEFDRLKVPAPCIIYFEENNGSSSYIGIARSKRSVSTIDSAIKITDTIDIVPNSPEKLEQIINSERFKTLFRQRIKNQTIVMPPKLSIEIINSLLSIDYNRKAIENIGQKITGFLSLRHSAKLQMDAIRLAMATFGIGKTEEPLTIEIKQGSDSTLRYLNSQRIIEDNVIAHDARSIPEFNLISSDLTGRAIFERGSERLEILTANRTRLESAFGVDLIYINSTRKNVVMVQYKMLEKTGSDWIFRPDKQFYDEKRKMQLKTGEQHNDYRLNANPYYFKFINRFQTDGTLGSFLIPLDHLDTILEDPNFKGPRGGTLISYNILDGRYLRESNFLGLIQSGYIGIHSNEFDVISALFHMVLDSGKNALVYAWQSEVER